MKARSGAPSPTRSCGTIPTSSPCSRSAAANCRLLEALEAVYPHRADCLDEDYCEIVILSKFPSSPATAHPWRQPPLVRVDYGPELGEVTVLAGHTMRPPLFGPPAHADEGAWGMCSRRPAGPGSCSATSTPRRARGCSRPFIERSGLELASGLATWPATLGLPQIAIDHILVSPDLRIARARPHRLGRRVRPLPGDRRDRHPAQRLNSHKARLRTMLMTIEVMMGK
jgi:hypothetical protein